MLFVFWQSSVDSFYCYYIMDVFITMPYLTIWGFLVDRACHLSFDCENRLRLYLMIYSKIAIVCFLQKTWQSHYWIHVLWTLEFTWK